MGLANATLLTEVMFSEAFTTGKRCFHFHFHPESQLYPPSSKDIPPNPLFSSSEIGVPPWFSELIDPINAFPNEKCQANGAARGKSSNNVLHTCSGSLSELLRRFVTLQFQGGLGPRYQIFYVRPSCCLSFYRHCHFLSLFVRIQG